MKKVKKMFLCVVMALFVLVGAKFNVCANETTESETTETIRYAFNESWQQLSYDEKICYIKLLQQEIAVDLGIDIPETVFYYSEEDGYLGLYYFKSHALHLNTYRINDPQKVIKAVCHEMRHAWQDIQIQTGTDAGMQYLQNLQNYYSPATCTEEEYRYKNIVEVDAYAYHEEKLELYWCN